MSLLLLRLLNALIYSLIGVVTFMCGVYWSRGDKRNALFLLVVATALEFLAVYSYTDVLAGQLGEAP